MQQPIPAFRHGALFALAAFHAVAGVGLALVCPDHPAPSSAVFLGLIFCQTSLLGMWAGFGRTHVLLRLAGMMLGVVLVTLVLTIGASSDPVGVLLLLVFVATSIVGLTTWIVRLCKARLVFAGEDAMHAREGLQFTIRHLLLLTFMVACLVTVGKRLAPQFNVINLAAQVVVLGLCFVAVALAAIWAVLGSGRWPVRSVPVLMIAGACGGIGGFVINNSKYSFWIAVTVLEALFLIASLLVIRRSGYRLMALR
jgi:hypothetical protein